MELKVKNDFFEVTLVRLLETNDSNSGLYVIEYKEFDFENNVLFSGIIKRCESEQPFNSILEIIIFLRYLFQTTQDRQKEILSQYLKNFDLHQERHLERVNKLITTLEKFEHLLSNYYFNEGEPPPLRYENN